MSTTYHLSGALTASQILTGEPGDTWILDSDASIAIETESSYAIIDRGTDQVIYENTVIEIGGTINAADYGALLYGVHAVSVNEGASVTADGTGFSFVSSTGGSSINNHGTISSSAGGIDFWETATVNNYGTIDAEMGIINWSSTETSTITNASGASISSNNLAIAAYAKTDIVNAGSISSTMTAVYISSDDVAVDNSGAIEGDSYGVRFLSGERGVVTNQTGGVIKGMYAVYSSAGELELTNHGEISDSMYGVMSEGASALIHNDGTIAATDTGVESRGAGARIENAGSIAGDVNGVRIVGADSTLINAAGASIDGGQRAVFLAASDGKATFNNAGAVVSSGGLAILGIEGASIVKNSGAITGDILLGAGDDRFTNAGGTVSGQIDLQAGSDLYVIDAKSLTVAEADRGNAGDIDTVKASVSYTLGANIENLVLTGTKKLSATGNGLANDIAGNKADNRLTGAGGRDDFIFTRSSGHDRIMDFQDGRDHIDLSTYRGISGWSDIRHDIVAHRTYVTVDLGHGDVVRIDQISAGDLSSADFVF